MANTPHPLDVAVDTFPEVRRLILRQFLSDDQIDEYERCVLEAVDALANQVSGYRLREVASDSFKRNGASVLTMQRFEDAGAQLIDLTAERRVRRSNVVAFPTRQDAG
jgi:HJR/Mrr/RecB family endonuclease